MLIDNAQLTMRKADMGIASLYADLVRMTRRSGGGCFAILSAEFERTEKAILAVTGQEAPPRARARPAALGRSSRNPYIDPLNYIQVEMIRRLRGGGSAQSRDADAIRSVIELTINGISGGLKNTG